MDGIPDTIRSEEDLGEFLATPCRDLVAMMGRLDGDILILGAGGKMGPSLARLARRACREAAADKRVLAVSDVFADTDRRSLEQDDIETILCDLLDPERVRELPPVKNIIYMAGRKFGTEGAEGLTWMVNVVAPANVARTFPGSRIVAFSTGCVYPLVVPSGGSVENDPPAPVGEYASSCLGRERAFEYYSAKNGTSVLLFRLNYAVDLRYGVLVDIARNVFEGRPVDLSVNAFNVIWQGDAVSRALLSLEHAAVPPMPLNVTGPEILVVEAVAKEFGARFGKDVVFAGADSGKAYLSNARLSIDLFGPPKVGAATMIRWVADWIRRGGPTLGKPTHFQVTDGRY